MPVFKTTWIFGLARHGFTETWYRIESGADPHNAMVVAKEYAYLRAKLLGHNANIHAIRVSNTENRRQKAFTEYVNYPGNAELDENNVPIHGAAASNVALNMQWMNTDFTQEKLIQLRGIWDDFEQDGGAPAILDPTYIALIQAWGAKIDAKQYGWLGTSTVQRMDISALVINDNGTLTITTGGNFFTVDQVNAKANVSVRVANFVASPNLNGALTVFPISQTVCRTIRPIALTATTISGTLQRNVKTFYTAAGGRIQRIGNRQAGAPLLQSAGRGPVRVRG